MGSIHQLVYSVLSAAETPTTSERGVQISDFIGLGIVLILVALNGFFVAAEFALVSVRQTRITQLVNEGSGAAKGVQKAITHLDDYIAATQLGITLASLALGWIGEPALEHLIEPPVTALLGDWGAGVATGLSVALAFMFITTVHIIIGELAPKSVALQRSEGTSLFVIRPLDLFLRVFRPFIWLLNTLGRLAVRAIGLRAADEHSRIHSVEELEMLVAQSRQAGMLDAEEAILLRRAFEFNDKTARQIMMPRTEVVGVPEDATLDELVAKASDERYTRFPVYRETLDQIIGVIHVKDLFPLVRKLVQSQNATLNVSAAGYNNGSGTSVTAIQVNQNVPLSEIIRPVFNVPESIHVADLLTQMRQSQAHLAVVIDEYGGTSGIVTLEDVLEELIGDVQDEFDEGEENPETEIQNLPDGSTLVSGLVTLATIEERFGLKVPEELNEVFDTIGGYVLGMLGRVPQVGDSVRLHQYHLAVIKMDGLRIDRIQISKEE